MFHSIIIPHRKRRQHLLQCIASVRRSADCCKETDWEIVIVDNSRTALPESTQEERVRVVGDPQNGSIYNKAKALNLGIQHARGDALTFLDADAVVGLRFITGARQLLTGDCDRVCYRVRTMIDGQDIAKSPNAPIAYEAYGRWDNNLRDPNCGLQPWGNSQFSILRESLGDIRYDEFYEGRGYEDLDMNMQLWAKFGNQYRGIIFTDPESAMVHLHSPGADPSWNSHDAKMRSLEHYRNKMLQVLAEASA